jgi:hypothetical protein
MRTLHAHYLFRLGNHTFSGGAVGLILLIPPLKQVNSEVFQDANGVKQLME